MIILVISTLIYLMRVGVHWCMSSGLGVYSELSALKSKFEVWCLDALLNIFFLFIITLNFLFHEGEKGGSVRSQCHSKIQTSFNVSAQD